jgi:hypothetical protein
VENVVYHLYVDSGIRFIGGVYILGIKGARSIDALGNLEGPAILPVDGRCCSWIYMFHGIPWVHVGSLVSTSRQDETNYRIPLLSLAISIVSLHELRLDHIVFLAAILLRGIG